MSELRTNRIIPRDGLVSGTNLGGGIIQCKMGVKTDIFKVQGTNNGAYTEVTGLNVTITPTRSDSKIMVDASITMVANEANYHMGLEIRRGSTKISGFEADTAGTSRTPAMATVNSTGYSKAETVPMMCMDSPATTSAVTYKVWGSIESNRYWCINGFDGQNDAYTIYRGISVIRAWEISG